ncbi:MAG: glycosyltransferase [Chloroflexi bacterium]|nr:glycosyltransferase [Chloroflexota bacterium]
MKNNIEYPNKTQINNDRIVVVIPTKNEENTIHEIVTGALEYTQEVVVMDGNSIDNTATIARKAGAKVHLDNGLGKGSALRSSLELIEADIIVFIDSDGSHDPADIPKLVQPILDDETDLCVGSRFTGGSDELSVNVRQLIRTIGNILMNIVINRRWHTDLTDTLDGFRAIRFQAINSIGLTENSHTIEQEIVMKMLRHKYRVMNVPTHEYARKYGESHINIWREWPRFVWCLLKNLYPKYLV